MTRVFAAFLVLQSAWSCGAIHLDAQESPGGTGGTQGAGVVIFRPLHGSVEVDAWSRDSIRWEGGDPSEVAIEVERTGPVLELHERRTRDSSQAFRYRLRVPADTRVRIVIRTGSLSAQGLAAGGRFAVQDGEIELSDGSGTFELTTVNGPITVRDTDGHLDISSVAGALTLTGVSGEVVARNTSGDIAVRAVGATVVHAESYSGRVTFEGPLSLAEPSEFHSHSGAVELSPDSLVSGIFHLRAIEGREEVRCPEGRVTDLANGRRLVVGEGPGVQVDVTTFSGSIRLLCHQ